MGIHRKWEKIYATIRQSEHNYTIQEIRNKKPAKDDDPTRVSVVRYLFSERGVVNKLMRDIYRRGVAGLQVEEPGFKDADRKPIFTT